MIVKNKPVYYCEHCKKRYLSRHHGEKHEKRCTKNPGRACGFCKDKERFKKALEKWTEKAQAYLDEAPLPWDRPMPWEGDESWQQASEALKWQDIKADVGGCPACTLSILNITRINHACLGNDSGFDYKTERKRWWDKENAEMGYEG